MSRLLPPLDSESTCDVLERGRRLSTHIYTSLSTILSGSAFALLFHNMADEHPFLAQAQSSSLQLASLAQAQLLKVQQCNDTRRLERSEDFRAHVDEIFSLCNICYDVLDGNQAQKQEEDILTLVEQVKNVIEWNESAPV